MAQATLLNASPPVGPPAPWERVVRFEEQDDNKVPTGKHATFTGVDLTPLAYEDLVDKALDGRTAIPLDWKHAKVIDSTIPEITVESFASAHASLESDFTSKALGLVKGGWLPSGLALQSSMIVLPDRCTVTELRGRFAAGKKRMFDDQDFLDFFSDKGLRINPLLYALEGNLRRNPTPEVVEQQLQEVYRVLRVALPDAELVPGEREGFAGVVGLVMDSQATMAQKQAFLMRMAPLLQGPAAADRKALLWDEALATARACAVPAQSLIVLAVLSSIMVSAGSNPAKRLLKPTADYTAEQAYNALADLRSLEILMALFCLFPDQRLMLCTGDKNLALFWAGLRAWGFRWHGKAATFKLAPIDALLPGMTSAQAGTLREAPASK